MDYHPISLVHTTVKIIAKVRSSLLAPFMNNITSNAQSAFIKKRSIHVNIMYVRNFACCLHGNKKVTLLFMLDICKAIDSIRWDYKLWMMLSFSKEKSSSQRKASGGAVGEGVRR